MNKKVLSIFIFIAVSFSQVMEQVNTNANDRYVSGKNGLSMYVNIWGHVANPGRILVNEGIDLATLLSLSGGPSKGANMKKIKVYHEYPHKDGKIFHEIDLTDFINSGDRSNFIEIYPNDTFIINQTAWSYFIEEVNTIDTFMNLINFYLNLKNLVSN